MSEPIRNLDAALSRVGDRWDAERTERTLAQVHRKHAQRKQRRKQLAATSGVCAIGLLVFIGWQNRPATETSAPTAPPVASNVAATAQQMQLADGSSIALRDARARVVVSEMEDSRATLELVEGAASFDVTHRMHRTFRVRSGDVTVEVLGTAFELERQASRTRVSVSRGRVAVSWPGGRTELGAGEAGWFPRVNEPAAAVAPDASVHGQKRGARKPVTRAVPAMQQVSTWREPAEQGDFERAYALLEKTERPVANDVEELLLAADSARLSGHAEASLPFLRRVVTDHAQDSRAPLAAFTLGGVLMQQLGQPREAEAAYARARELSLNASLAEDALARQVEAAHRAGDTAHARVLATEYLERYPKGRRVNAVRRFGSIPR